MPQRSQSSSGRSQGSTDRDERGRFTEESATRGDNSSSMSGGSRSQGSTDRDERGRFTEDSSSRTSGGQGMSGNRNTTRKK
jgi:hypothetical protein